MTMRHLLADHPIVPVIVLDDASAAVDLAEALSAGGIHCAEITLRTPTAADTIASIAGVADFVVGAGTVLTVADLDRSVDAGARFVVSPGFDEAVVEHALEMGVGVLPGAATATEVQRAMGAGVDVVKFFPAGQLGGLRTIDALAAPFAGIGFVPSGGVTPDNAAEYLAHPAVPAISGSWMAGRELLAHRDFDEIRRRTADAVARIAGTAGTAG
jgi:2-dehydro-3-deoxyphosphogluconate aldolase/(4S)-4-hydroxy-2-oxoglutarate aldolase